MGPVACETVFAEPGQEPKQLRVDQRDLVNGSVRWADRGAMTKKIGAPRRVGRPDICSDGG
jgi:hypothetical protein